MIVTVLIFKLDEILLVQTSERNFIITIDKACILEIVLKKSFEQYLLEDKLLLVLDNNDDGSLANVTFIAGHFVTPTC